MGAHVILISVESKKALSTTIPLVTFTTQGMSYGDSILLNEGALRLLSARYEREFEFVTENPDALLESDAHGQVSAEDVVFDVKDERGYRFVYSGW